jgi:hypothetical protein
MMVFNENGNYISRYRGEATGEATYIFRNVPLSDAPRTLHFVANYDWTTFPDRNMISLAENEVIGSMSTRGGTVAFWQRITVPMIDNPTSPLVIPGSIHLLRNVAQVSVANNTSEGAHSLSEMEFAVGNYFDSGSVAPYNTLTAAFGTGDVAIDTPPEDFITEARGGSPTPVVDADFRPIENGAIDIYERRNSTATAQTFVIIRGKYDDATTLSYYKIDIVDATGTTLWDLRRNHRYNIDVTLVSHAGYPTLAEAVQNAASNNINAAVTVAEYTAISDGAGILRIEGSSFTYVTPGTPFEIRYAYIDTATGQTNNEGISITLEEVDGQRVVAAGTFGYTTTPQPWLPGRDGGYIRGTTATLPTGFDIYRAWVHVSKGNLSRVIQLQLRRPMSLTNVTTLPTDGRVAGSVGAALEISFRMPVDISPSLFPMPIYITTKRFSPDTSRGELSVDVSGGDFRYVYDAPYLVDANDQPLTHTIYLVSNSTDPAEVITISSETFGSTTVTITEAN